MSVKTYSKKKDGNKYLSANFRVDEFACHDGTDTILIADDLVNILQALRNHFGRAITLNSGYRTLSWNAKVGGEINSFHTKGMAADFNISGWSPQSVRKVVEKGKILGVDPEKIGLGAYSAFTHIDCRGFKSRW